jgi:acetyl-CoA acetyltransferase
MNRTKYAAAGVVLALACALALTGCPKDAGDPGIDSKLVDKWTNGSTVSYLEKKFEIKADGFFDAYLNPTALSAYGAALSQGQVAAAAAAQAVVAGAAQAEIDIDWHVTGKLVRVEGDVYKMDSLKADASDRLITDPTKTPPGTSGAALALKSIIQNVRITLADGGNTFTFSNAGTDASTDPINMFFGGTYSRVSK